MENVVEMPTIEVWEEGGWGVLLPAAVLPDGVEEIGVTSRGLYIGLKNGRYDLMPWSELCELVDVEGADRVDEPSPYRLTPLGLATFLGESVRVLRGEAPVVVTGQELALMAWLNGGELQYPMQPERLVVSNGAGRSLAA